MGSFASFADYEVIISMHTLYFHISNASWPHRAVNILRLQAQQLINLGLQRLFVLRPCFLHRTDITSRALDLAFQLGLDFYEK